MTLPEQTAKHFRDVHFGGNWTTTNLKEVLSDVTWQQATTKINSFNTIATLVFHINYFVGTVLRVLEEGKLEGNDKFSFNHPPIRCEEDWKKMLDKTFSEAEQLSALLEKVPEHLFWEDFIDPKYGNYFRNFHGIIEHTHYHLGQIVVLKKLIVESSALKIKK